MKMRKNNKNKIIFSTATIIVIIIITFTLLPLLSCRKETSEIETFKVKRGDILQTVSTSGYVDTTEETNYSLPISGEVIKCLEKGDYFKKGDLIVKIDDKKLKLLINQAEENLKLAQNSIELAKLNYQQALDANHIAVQLADLNIELSEQATQNALTALEDANRYLNEVKKYEFSTDPQIAQAISQSHSAEGAYYQSITNQAITYWSSLGEKQNASNQILITEKNIRQAEIQLNLSKINLELAKIDLGNSEIYAPFDGIVSSSTFKEGEYASPGVNAISIIKDDFIIKAEVDETDIGKLNIGNPVEIILDAYPEQEFTGKITKISPISKNVSGVVSFEITVKPDNNNKSDVKLLYGLSASLTITTSKAENILYIPIQSVYEENGKEYVDILTEDGKIKKVEVRTGIYNYDFIEIKSGLKEGDVILTSKIEY